MTSLSLQRLTKTFGTFTALNDVSIEIPSGKFVCLLGPSGCGKTTLLRLLAGLEEPTSGRILVDGKDQTGVPAHSRDFGMVFQSLALFPHLDVQENVTYPLTIRRRSRAERNARANELMELVKLSGHGTRRIHQLSGGQRQRVAIARGLAIDPRVFLLDEPLSALDANLREHMQIELRQLQQQLGITTIVVTHDQKEAMTMADLVIVLNEGEVQQAGAPMEVYRDPANVFVAAFIGTSNLLPCRVTGPDSIELDGRPIPLRPGDRLKAPVGAAILSVRPEDVSIDPDPGAGEIEASISFVRELGESVQISLIAGDREVVAAMTPRDRPTVEIGQRVGLHFQPGKRVVLPA